VDQKNRRPAVENVQIDLSGKTSPRKNACTDSNVRLYYLRINCAHPSVAFSPCVSSLARFRITGKKRIADKRRRRDISAGCQSTTAQTNNGAVVSVGFKVPIYSAVDTPTEMRACVRRAGRKYRRATNTYENGRTWEGEVRLGSSDLNPLPPCTLKPRL